MTIYFYKSTEINGSKHVKIPLRSSATINYENEDKYCLLWSLLASLHPCINNHPNRVSSHKKCFEYIKFDGFDFITGFKCSDVQNLENSQKLSTNVFEIICDQDQKEWILKLIPIEIRKIVSDKDIEFMIYKNHQFRI